MVNQTTVAGTMCVLFCYEQNTISGTNIHIWSTTPYGILGDYVTSIVLYYIFSHGWTPLFHKDMQSLHHEEGVSLPF